jgi:two-component system, OmpR family, sensor histidine kinase KdpD
MNQGIEGEDNPDAAGAQPALLNWLQHSFRALTGVEKPLAALPSIASPSLQAGGGLAGYSWAILACGFATVLALALRGLLAPANLVLLYLMAVVLVAVRFGRKPGVLASILAVLAFDVFLVPPYYSLTVADPQYLLTFAIMLTVALIISYLTANLRHQALIAHYRERRASALFDLSKDLSAALTTAQIAEIGSRHLAPMFLAKVILLLPDPHGKLFAADGECGSGLAADDALLAAAQQAYDRPATAGEQNDASISDGVVHLLLRAPMSTRGVLLVKPENPALIQLPEQNRLLQTCAAQIALALERVHYVDVAQGALVSMESERLRNSLLSAISHDIRTPLTAIVGLSSTLATARPLPEQTRKELAEAIQDNAVRMSNLVTNLLDMARLHAGAIQLNRQWQMLEEVVGSSLAMLSATLSGLRIEVDLPATLPLLEFDAVLMERVFCNLLDNAAKYAAAGGMVRIAAELIGHEVQVAVEDDGPGVPAGMEDSIFTKFTRGELESSQAGVGLGLSICHSIIEAHGGRISAENRSEGGVRFLFTLPIGSPPADEAVDAADFNDTAGTP